MYSSEDLQSIAEKGLIEVELNREPNELFAPLRYFLSAGGKRIRPIITLMSCNVFCDNIQSAVAPAIALELFHNFTLIHDDIMDNADVRRNLETVHKKWDSNTAILSGDALMVVAYEMLQKSDKDKVVQILAVFNQVALEVCQGQQMDMNFERSNFVTEEEYLRMVELKTAALLSGCTKIGAICGGASEPDQANMDRFARNLGIAFQLQDDLLDSFGDISKFGKKIGGDIVANKKTYLLITALKRAQGNQLELLNGYLNMGTADPDRKIQGIIAIYNDLKVREATELIVEDYFARAFKYLRCVNQPIERLVEIEQLAIKMMSRNS
ncbi:polyprenyl synthetase family protein [Williamwhitmania taraxaci]|uniref:Geranylgeranyl diphosphate synthase, type II n=1 Tax=Williamwhitmania taraxaci TaxID=1640674 RepID=A0A1G6H161_9BACT|nr:polyprenyl synthetase family protein [Williamwhitmania taraxaci]SDB87126.1 geranylgeranyl diphosphate synthase, type II [Williamwhitmania taraxaci]